MKKLFGILLLTGIFWGSYAADKKNNPLSLYKEIDRKTSPNNLTKAEQKKGWTLLFDGKTTNGWHGYNLQEFPAIWTIENGTLTTHNMTAKESQDITTDKSYGSFAISIDFKVAKNSNSGIIYHVKEDPKYKYPYETGPEFQIMDLRPGQSSLQSLGANYGMQAPKAFPFNENEWNSLMLVVDGNHVTHIINGVVIVEFDMNTPEWIKLRDSGKWKDYPDYGKYTEGKIDLQNHGTPIWFQNIKIKELK